MSVLDAIYGADAFSEWYGVGGGWRRVSLSALMVQVQGLVP